jgi:predicted ATP-grasp superfamily ATP-dependent carboligase
MPQTVLLTLGRLPKALELARALSGAGCRVIIAEPFARHVCKPSRAVFRSHVVAAPNHDRERYLQDLLQVIERERVDLVIPVSEEALHVGQLENRLPLGVRLHSAPLSTILRLHDKFGFAQDARALGLDVPDTFEWNDPGLADFCAANDFVVKPRNSCSGIGVSIHRKGTVPRSLSLPEGAIIQGFVPGRHVSTFTLAEKGRELFTVAYEGTVFAGTVAVCFRRVDGLAAVQAWVRDFVAATGHSGFISFDFIVAQDGKARAIECNPRITSGIHFAEPGDLAQAVLAPERAGRVRMREKTKFQQGYSTLTEAYAHFLRPREFAARMREMFSARDVVWSAQDPMPFLLMTPMSWDILKPAMMGRMTLGEAAMHDIGWFDDIEPPGNSRLREKGSAHAAPVP